jgi:Ohr subfamily peroxiredoxin
LYTAKATSTGAARAGHVESSDGVLTLDLSIPKEMGGAGGAGTNPEQLFAAGFASCFGSALSLVGKRKKAEADDAAIESKVHFMTGEERSFKLAVEMDVTLPSISDAEQAKELVRVAHKVCPYSNATRGNIDVAFIVNGEPLDI